MGCVYLRNDYCMFYGLPTCPKNKKCLEPGFEPYDKPKSFMVPKIVPIYPPVPALTKGAKDTTRYLASKHQEICYLFDNGYELEEITEILELDERTAKTLKYYVARYIINAGGVIHDTVWVRPEEADL